MITCAAVFNICRQEKNMSRDKEAGEMTDTEQLQAGNDVDVSVCVDSEHRTNVNTEQPQMNDNTSTEATNNTASSVPEALQCTDQQYNSCEPEGTSGAVNCASVSGLHTNSTAVNNYNSHEWHLSLFSDVPISKAVTSHCLKNSDDSHSNSSSKSASVSAALSTTSSGTVRQSSVELFPKPTYTLLPIGVRVPVLVVVNSGSIQSSHDRTPLPTIAPRPAKVISSNARVPAISHEDLSVVGRGDSLHDDVLLHRKQQKSVASVVTQTASLPARPRHKTAAAATQTCECFASASRLSKQSRASQVLHV